VHKLELSITSHPKHKTTQTKQICPKVTKVK
jgi:hypothetical protein